VHGEGHPEASTIRGARAVGVVCAVLFLALIPLSIAFPAAFLYAPYHAVYARITVAVLFAMGLGLLLALRDPARNAGVYAVIGLIAGSLTAALAYALVVEGADPAHWIVQVPVLGASAVVLVGAYSRLRRPHPIVVRIVVAAVLLMPAGLYLYDAAYRAFVR
jgi:peptidoglycan/LPS O-acetylase OafA/YrhL